MDNILEIDSVIKSYGVNQILTDIYIKVKTGDILGIFGRNGTGKSTLLKIIFGTLRAERKFIRLDGKILHHAYKTDHGICYLPQNDFIPKQLKVFQAAKSFLASSCYESFFDDSMLQNLTDKKITDLSPGELRYFEIKLLLCAPSKFILLDEPFTGISPVMVEELSRLIIASSTSRGIILTDHVYQYVLDVANRFCILYDGGLKYFVNKTDLIKWGYINESKLHLLVPKSVHLQS